MHSGETKPEMASHSLPPLQVTIADDYSDPFDAKNDLKSKAGKGESAGYMEPYEAQRIMTGEQGTGTEFRFVLCYCDRIPGSGRFITSVYQKEAFFCDSTIGRYSSH